MGRREWEGYEVRELRFFRADARVGKEATGACLLLGTQMIDKTDLLCVSGFTRFPSRLKRQPLPHLLGQRTRQKIRSPNEFRMVKNDTYMKKMVKISGGVALRAATSGAELVSSYPSHAVSV